jgi:hypothetical protein
MTRSANPGLPGRREFDTVVYAGAGLNYSAVPALAQYQLYDTPHPAFVTGRIDISAFANLGSAPWPFQPSNVPLNGQVCIPRGRGPFPLVVFAHGNHGALANSTPGYLYLCELLASHGVIAATIDVNFLNGFNFGENGGRAIVHLEHLVQFRRWNATPHHRLHGRVNLDRIMIVGHSRGGEAVGHASLFNTLTAVQPTPGSPTVPLDGSAGLGPYGFHLRAVAAIAPTDRQYEPVSGPTVVPDPYYLLHGSRDGDVSSFEGYNTHARCHGVDPANPTISDGRFKALLWVIGANHNQFNSVWPSEPGAAVPIPRADQEQIAKVHLGALAQALLLGRSGYLKVLRDHAVATTWVPVGSDFVSQYQDPHRVFLMHNQEGLAPPQVSAPVQGVVVAAGIGAVRQADDLVNSGAPPPYLTLRADWGQPGGRLDVDVVPGSLPPSRYRVLALRVGQSDEPGNPVGVDQDFTLEVASGSRVATLRASSLHRLRYPDVAPGAGKIVMQSLRLSTRRLARLGVDVRDLRQVRLSFDRTPSGVVYLGDLQLSD